jgi:hypothetical protein
MSAKRRLPDDVQAEPKDRTVKVRELAAMLAQQASRLTTGARFGEVVTREAADTIAEFQATAALLQETIADPADTIA